MPEYSHTLVPDRVQFVPDSAQVGDFLAALVSLGATPLQGTLAVSKPTGKVRIVNDRFTGQTRTLVTHKANKLKDITAVPRALVGLDDYVLSLEGKGPPKLPAFAFKIRGGYELMIRCVLRPEIVSTADPHDEAPLKRKVALFGQPCSAKDRLGVFHNPETLDVIEVPKAGCARFWIEFEFGQSLFPPIDDRLVPIEPKIVAAATAAFGVKFMEGCRWCA